LVIVNELSDEGGKIGEMNLFEQVYDVVKRIPVGMVMTYGQVAKVVGTRDARRVGQALHANRSSQIPCHRVVFANGSLAPGFAFGGCAEQKERLLKEGVEFAGETVNMERCLHSFK
jgi:methylated-DNA-protein-cysteine methyltransferase related protein